MEKQGKKEGRGEKVTLLVVKGAWGEGEAIEKGYLE